MEKIIFDGKYLITSEGKVFSLYNRKIKRDFPVEVKTYDDKKGYKHIYVDGKMRLVHRLVLESFIGECPFGLIGGHKNDVKSDNRLENLHWITYKQNSKEAMDNGKAHFGSRTATSKLNENQVHEIRDLFSKGHNKSSLARKFSVHRTSIRDIVSGKNWKYLKSVNGSEGLK